MTALLFDASCLLVAPFGLLMIALPGWRVTPRVVASPWIAAPAAALYLALVLPGLPATLGAVARPSLAAIAPLLFLTLMLGPVGLLGYLAVRGRRARPA